MSRRRPKPRVLLQLGNHSQHCPWCTRQWWRWLAMMLDRKWGGERFYDHAATSNRGPSPGEPHDDVYPVYVGRPQSYTIDPDEPMLDIVVSARGGVYMANLGEVIDRAAARFDERPLHRASIAARRELAGEGDES